MKFIILMLILSATIENTYSKTENDNNHKTSEFESNADRQSQNNIFESVQDGICKLVVGSISNFRPSNLIRDTDILDPEFLTFEDEQIRDQRRQECFSVVNNLYDLYLQVCPVNELIWGVIEDQRSAQLNLCEQQI